MDEDITRYFNPEQAAATFRTLLQGASAYFFGAGVAEADWVQSGIGLAAFGVFLAWGVYVRRDKALLASAANVPTVQAVVTSSPAVATEVPSPKVVSVVPPGLMARGPGFG